MTPLRRLLEYFTRHKATLAWGALCVAASSVFSLMKPLIVGNAVNELTKAVSRGALIRYGLLLVGAAAMEGFFLYLQRSILIGASRTIEYEMRNDFYEHLQKLPVHYYQEQRTGDLMSRATNDLSSVRMLIGPAVMHSISSLLVVIGAFVMMVRIDRTMSLLSLISMPVIVIMVKFFGQKIHVRFKSVQDYFGDISARVQENLAGVRVVRAFAQEEIETETFKRMNREFVERNRTLIKLTATYYPALHAMIGIMFGIIFFVGSRQMIAGTLSIGSFVAFQLYLGRMVWPLIGLGWVTNLFQRGMASMVRLHEVWDVQPDVLPDDGERIAEPARGDIEIRGLTFAYPAMLAPPTAFAAGALRDPNALAASQASVVDGGPPAEAATDVGDNDRIAEDSGDRTLHCVPRPAGERRNVLTDVTLHVRPGQTVGIVGRTGSGKSTLLALVTRTFEPPAGTILIDSRPIESIRPEQLREWIGMVPQETFLFSESIAENIRFGRAEASAEEVREAADLAGLTSDVASFSQGLETVIGERGITLSGGQKQRAAIARALVRDPTILILDDSLSAVDTATEERILRALREIRKGRTVLIVSHRVSSVKDADTIIVLEEGRIVERGTHDSLLAQEGYYADLYRRQTLEEEIAEIA